MTDHHVNRRADDLSWHQMDVSAVLERLGVDRAEGLSDAVVRDRLRHFGPNELIERAGKSGWEILREQLSGIFVVILMLAGIASIFLGDNKDALAIFAIVLLNTVIGFFQEFRAERAIAALKKLAVPSVAVRRSGRTEVVTGPQLVPGDIVYIESGNIVPADCRLVDTKNLRIQEAVLTGESEPVEKRTEALSLRELPIGDRHNMAYMGTPVAYGRAEAVVIATGMRTELGRIAEMLQSVTRQPTPLQQRLASLARDLAIAAIFLVSVIFLIGLIQGEALGLLFLTTISLLVAAVPEGLPAVVTIALALGTQRMLRRYALVRKLTAVETLGSVTVICSDKTGTLTENRMTVAILDVAGHRLQVAEHIRANKSISGLEAEVGGHVLQDSGHVLMLAGTALCNDAVLQVEQARPGQFRAIGDPTEAAMIVAAAHYGLLKPSLEAAMPRQHEAPFDSQRKRMTTVHLIDRDSIRSITVRHPIMHRALSTIGAAATHRESSYIAFTKGAVDGLLSCCTHVCVDSDREPLTRDWLESIERTNEELAQTGMRVLGVAARTLNKTEAYGNAESLERELTFVGLIGLSDPPRQGVKAAIQTCKQAGVRTVMITGDHPATANQIAHELDITANGRPVSGPELGALSVEELTGFVDDVSVYARVSPEHKLKIVEALQRRGHVVAMTGDGVNDAPALKRANVGVAMGVTGTDVAKDAADMVLLDDNFTTIVAAVEEGRVIYDNLRKFIKYVLTGNAAEILVVLFAPLIGMPLPLLPLQILWINLVTDGLPGLALAVEPAEPGTMKRRPYGIQEGVFAGGIAQQIVWIGIFIGVVSLGLGYWYWILGREEWQTIVFTTLTLSELAAVMAIRSSRDSLFRIGIFSNKHLTVVVALTFLLQIALIYVAPLQALFKTKPLMPADLIWSIGCSSAIFWAIEVEKYRARRSTAQDVENAR